MIKTIYRLITLIFRPLKQHKRKPIKDMTHKELQEFLDIA